VNERGQEPCAQSYGTRRVPTTFNVYLFLEFTIITIHVRFYLSVLKYQQNLYTLKN
jgi:hypothetical protein